MNEGVVVGETDYDSRRRRWQVALDRDPPHLGLFNVKGTAIVADAGNGYYAEETLATIRHDLGYKPVPLVYYYVLTPFTGNPFIGTANEYSGGTYVYAGGVFNDLLVWEVDETNLYIKHILDDTLFKFGRTSDAPDRGDIRVKYLINSNPLEKLHQSV